MEGGGIYRASNSFRAGSFTMSRNNPIGASSRSLRDEDDEEALKWAAIERLPTLERLRKGILTSSHGANEVDISNLGFEARRNLMERLVKDAEEDNEKFLLKLKNRIDRVGINLPTIEVRFEHLNIEAEAYVGSRALPSFINFTFDLLEGLLGVFHVRARKKKFTILHDVSGIIKPRRMTLLLGPPSSGKTTLLLALAGQLDRDLKSTGRVTYNGHELNEFVPERTAAYISQHDLHIGEMTVRETLAFSARCQGVGDRYDMIAELCRREKAANIKPDTDIDIYMKAAAQEGQEVNVVTDYILKILGLEVCADTIVGDDMQRGISGGQRKRLTTGEMIVGPTKVLFMDEISTGLDSSTTYQIVKSLKHCVHILNETAIISLLQPPPETYDLFDDLILLSDGHIVYQGPREFVLEFFESMGFKCPERKAVADFLQEVTSKKDQPQYWARTDNPYRFIKAEEFAEAFRLFHVGRKVGDELSIPFDRSKSHPAALSSKKYGVGKKELLKACTAREFLLMKRNSFVYIFKLIQLCLVAAITMTIFLRTNMNKNTMMDGSIYTGALFNTVVIVMFNGMSEIPMTVVKLPIFYKQRNFLFYPPWAYALPSWVLKIPITLFEVAVWTFMTYYVIGFDPCFKRFLKQYLLLILVNQVSSALFRLIAATSRNMIVANTFGTFIMLALFALGGVVLSGEQVKKWWLWGYWSSPLMYAQNAIVVNEFLGQSWSHVINVTGVPKPLGLLVLKSHGFFVDASWYWIGVGALAGIGLLYNLGFAMALTFLNPFGESRAINFGEPDIQLSSHTSKLKIGAKNGMGNIANRKRGMVLPFEPHFVTFNEIVYAVDMPQELKNQGIMEDRLVLLKGVSGAFRPGILTALMGVSGAGKTTLMDVLAGRKTGGYIEGNITISGYPKKHKTFARISGYCEQNDIHSPHVTVHESLVYSAWLRLPPNIDKETREMFVEEVMELVELNSLRNAIVGLPGVNGLSTEQRKRLTIAVELVANPSIIFMDEPTSGLDARAAAIVMRTVRNTVNTGRTVVCTIHQPSIDIFEAFDELFLMKRGGQEIYVGPLGQHCSELIQYFENIQGVRKISDGYNPATWMLEVTTPAQEMTLGVDFNVYYKNSDLYRRNKSLIKELSVPAPGSKDLYFPKRYPQSFSIQCMACLWKQNWSYWRNPSYTAVRFMFTTGIALTFGSMFWDLGGRTKTRQDLTNAMGSMYAAIFFIGLQYASAVQPVVSIERTVFYRERAAGMYSAMAYAFAQVLIEIPYIFVQACTYSLIVYAMIGFEWTVAKFFWYLFFMFFSLLYFTFYGMMTVAVTPNHHIANIVSIAFYGIWNIFSGFVIPRPSIPVWWRWNYWTCPVAWTLYGLIASQYGDKHDVMDTGETVQQYLKSFLGFRHDFVGVCAGVILGLTIFFAAIFAMSIRVFNFQKR